MDEKVFGCLNNTIRLRSGRYFDLSDPKPDQFTFTDIAGALSKICRYGGHSPWYSVAEHLVHCYRQAVADGLSVSAIRAVLMHDATEAFFGDVVKPLKNMLPEYDRIEAAVERAIGLKFGIDFQREAVHVRKIDRELLIAEKRFFFGRSETWTGENEVREVDVVIEEFTPSRAEWFFTKAAREAGIDVEI